MGDFYWPILGVLPSIQSNDTCLAGSMKFSIGRKGGTAYVAAEICFGASVLLVELCNTSFGSCSLFCRNPKVISCSITFPTYQVLQSSSEDLTVQNLLNLKFLDSISNYRWRGERWMSFMDKVFFIRSKKDGGKHWMCATKGGREL